VNQAASLLFQHLSDHLDFADHTADLPPPRPFPHADPHLLASAVQKAIRRGDVATARRAGHQLLALDRTRLWRRLAVTALEDIGTADIELAAEIVAIASLTAARRLFPSDLAALDYVLIRACSAAKDRSGDHLFSILNREPIPLEQAALLARASGDALLAVIASSHQPLPQRLRAAVLASGRSAEFYRPGAPGIGAVFDVLHELGVPSLLLIASEVYASRQRDELPVLVPLAALFHTNSKPLIRQHDLPTPELIGELPAYVFDPVNTRLGRRAVELWLKSYLAKPEWLPKQAAAALWNTESALCDRTLGSKLGDGIREHAYTADLIHRGLPIDRHAEINAWVASERPTLTAARQAVWNSFVRQSDTPVEVLEQANLPLPIPGAKKRSARYV
jgi:hypothetical protein